MADDKDDTETEGADIAGDVLIGIVACGVLAGDADGEVK